VFWKIGRELKSVLLAVTAYNPPKIDEKTVSEWFLELIVAVLTWYGIRAAHVSGATSDAGPDCKKDFSVLTRMQHGWTWLWSQIPDIFKLKPLDVSTFRGYPNR